MGGMTSFLLLLWVGLTVGKVVDLQKRIIGGHNCNNMERLYHVKLIVDNMTHESFCGGSLISDQWILTAAHCWEPGWTMTAQLRKPGKSETHKITEHQIFTDKDKNNNDREHDIMLLKLPSKVQITPVKPPDCGNEYNDVIKTGATVQIAGHAANTTGPNNTRVSGNVAELQCANIKVVKCPTLILVLDDLSGRLVNWSYQHFLCGNTTTGVDACLGDSGGGVVYNDKIYGVISNIGKYACTDAVKFMDVCKYKQWITDVIRPKTLLDKVKDCFGCG